MTQASKRDNPIVDEQEVSTRQKMVVFRRSDAIALRESHAMGEVLFSEAALTYIEKFDLALLSKGTTTEVVFRQTAPDGYSIVRAWFAPGYLLPRHSHSADCAYYVTAGELLLGRQVLGTGEGFFVPKDHPYSYEAGRSGVEVIEFRRATTFNIRFVDDEEKRWTTVFNRAKANETEWSEMRASHLGSLAGERVTQWLREEAGEP
jgi:quercetin dioxygenase-like cupin family protein